jgi:hypothetical protein
MDGTSNSVAEFAYDSEAELFPGKNRKYKARPVGYRRFTQAADAIRFAIENLPPELLAGAFLQIDEERFDSHGIRTLYESPAYPLARRAAPVR